MVAVIKMPALSPTMTEGKIVTWNKKIGDKIDVGDVILEVETDKAVMEVEAQNKGILGEILCELNSTIAVGETIALVLEKGETKDDLKKFSISQNADLNDKNSNNKDENSNNTLAVNDVADNDNNNDDNSDNSKKNNNNVNNVNKGVVDSNANCCLGNNNNVCNQYNNTCQQNVAFNNSNYCDKVFASPLAKSIAKMNNVDISQIASLNNGSGPNGRIIKADVEKFLLSNTGSSDNSVILHSIGRNAVEFVDVDPSGMRETIANRLTESKQQIPHWYLKISANMSKLVAFREELNKMAKIVNGIANYKVSVNDIIIMAVARALQRCPDVNVSWANGKIRKYNNIDVSVACSVGNGILTPVVKNADQKGLLEISSEIKKLVSLARDGKLSPNDYIGGGITVSNLGMYGVKEFSSIINPPQSCIIAVGSIEDDVIVDKDKNICICPVCNITISADHRVIDGFVLASFASELKLMLENPTMIVR